jgi:serine/threonine protein kinase
VKDYSIELPLRLLREVILTMKMGWSPPTHLAEDPLALARFEREAKAIAALSHPNILGVFDIGIEGAVAYAVTERLGEDTLRAKLMGGALPARKAVDYAAQMAQGLAAAHVAGGVLHRRFRAMSPDRASQQIRAARDRR